MPKQVAAPDNTTEPTADVPFADAIGWKTTKVASARWRRARLAKKALGTESREADDNNDKTKYFNCSPVVGSIIFIA
jgi:hypothetical protein